MNPIEKVSNHPCLLLLLALLVSSFVACKKTELPKEESDVSPTTGTRSQFTADSIFLYARQTYLWNEALPDYQHFNPRSYTASGSDLLNFKQIVFAISQAKINPVTSKPFEQTGAPGHPKYSYIQLLNGASGTLAAVNAEGVGDDFGIEVSSSGSDLYLRMVYPGSAAARSGLLRGDKVMQVNGQHATAGMILSALQGQNLNLTLLKKDGTPQEVSLNKSTYQSSAVLKTAEYLSGGTKLGYLAIAQFSHLNNSKTVLDQVFAQFASSGITDLVVDLRYNGGGYVGTAKYLANLIAPRNLNGKVMFTEHFNAQMQEGKAGILKNQLYFDENNQPVYLNGRRATYADVDFTVKGNTYNFEKAGGLETVKNLYFIVGNQTASASEMLINSLKPYFKVSLIGQPTYGKPVGFFGIKIDRFQLYLSSFLIRNSAGIGDYFDGMPVDIAVEDDVTHDFGDENEAALNAVFKRLNVNVGKGQGKTMSVRESAPVVSLPGQVKHISAGKGIPGMIEERLKLKYIEN
ncbi:S41 family peptidase [Pedobacter caeni]|uniref:Peptidase family S41 n=1 Tax=Pedobacter caeni TaxID=288992 RepID=A0A1M5J579_9SPHI|nr:S41 family peptidase [Pedobacter caeni]SHG35661.1 Peptidase family S41 [Pedobacter caeni]